MCISLFFRCTKTKKNWFCLDCLTLASQLKSICSFSKKKKITQFSFCRVLLFLWSPHCSSLPLLPLKCSFDNMKRFTRIWIREIPSSSKITTSVPVYKCMWRNKSLSLHLFLRLFHIHCQTLVLLTVIRNFLAVLFLFSPKWGKIRWKNNNFICLYFCLFLTHISENIATKMHWRIG